MNTKNKWNPNRYKYEKNEPPLNVPHPKRPSPFTPNVPHLIPNDPHLSPQTLGLGYTLSRWDSVDDD